MKMHLLTARSLFLLALILGAAGMVQAQQLEPRAYSPAPVGLNIAGLAAYYTTGNVVTDVASPVQNIHARVDMMMPFYGRTFGLLGRQASVTVATPVADAEVTGDVFDVGRAIERTGMMDPQLRFAMNLIGGLALQAEEFFKTRSGDHVRKRASWSMSPWGSTTARSLSISVPIAGRSSPSWASPIPSAAGSSRSMRVSGCSRQ